MTGGTDSTPEVSQLAGPKGLLRSLEKIFLYLDRLIGKIVPESLNPLQHSGAIAVTTFLIATVTGVVLLIWYRPSVTQAYSSVDAMSLAPYTAGLMRSLHRYSSDACMLFVIVHALRIICERRFGGARWLAWVTGIASLGLLWFIGWTGYWLVWDLRAQYVATGTARALDVLPIFADPLSRSFLTDAGVNSLLFFVVFFIHMIIPLAMAVVMWIHITRLARARFLTDKPMTTWVVGFLLVLCLVYPASSSDPAMMTALPRDISIDWWYLLPLAFTQRLGGDMLWALVILPGVVGFSVPWWLASRRKPVATVVESRCNECTKCFQDCPYEAIQMIPRTDGNTKYLNQASIIPSKCVSCGICAGSCDTAGVGVDWFSSIDQRRRVEAWMKEAESAGEDVRVAYTCAESAGAGLTIDAESGRCEELPGYRVMPVPCAGWVHPLMIERALRHGAKGVLIATCGPGQCLYREGESWERMRLEGTREPALRTDKVAPEELELVALDRTRKRDLIRAAERFAADAGSDGGATARRSPVLSALAAAVLALISAAVVGVISDAGFAAPPSQDSELLVSFKHPGAVAENCRVLSEEELAALPVHMRKAEECERMRAPVRLLVTVDGEEIVRSSFAPSGIWEDGNSVAIERIPIEPGEYRVSIAIGETLEPDEWTFRDEKTLSFDTEARRVIAFDRVAGFSWD